MTTSSAITQVLNATIDAVTHVVPLSITREQPTILNAPVLQQEIGVLIGITGDVRGRLIIESPSVVFGQIGQALFGMVLEGEMLDSFVGELGNMIAGNMATNASNLGVVMDITPPTVLVGETRLYGFEKALSIPIQIEGAGRMQILLIIEDQRES